MSAYEDITNKIVAAVESGRARGADSRMPWHSAGGLPVNVASGQPYRGINTIVLWGEAQERAYASPTWGTFKQWQSLGAQVRKGERGSLVVFWKDIPRGVDAEEDDRRFVLKTSYAFNAAQVDGYEMAPVQHASVDPCAAEKLAKAARIDVRFGGGRAFYHPRLDYVQMPPLSDFVSVPAFQSTLLHEAAHWTGHESRLDRTFGKRLGDCAYAFEELVAEIAAAFLCADLGVSNEPRIDHAQYIQDWLRVLKMDSRAIFTAASAAAKASDFLKGFQEARVAA